MFWIVPKQNLNSLFPVPNRKNRIDLLLKKLFWIFSAYILQSAWMDGLPRVYML